MNYCADSSLTAFALEYVGYDVATVAIDNTLVVYSRNNTNLLFICRMV